jgi:hypothetical protein
MAYFRIMPRYKSRAEGDRVLVDDMIMLVAVKSGHVLHASPNPLVDDNGDSSVEVTASQVRSCSVS